MSYPKQMQTQSQTETEVAPPSGQIVVARSASTDCVPPEVLPEVDAGSVPPVLRTPYDACPICGHGGRTPLHSADCRGYPTWHPPLPETLHWLRCDGCGHIHTDSFYNEAGLQELFSMSHPTQLAGGDLNQLRMLWAPVVERVLAHLPRRPTVFENGRLTWIDVGCGAGGLVLTADEFGFAATGLDLREQAVRLLRSLGYDAQKADLLSVQANAPIDVISMADLLEHTPYPVAMLRRAHELLDVQGVLYLSCPNFDSSVWRQMDLLGTNPYWREIEHYHNFSRKSLLWLLRNCGFTPVSYGVSNRYIACMEILAVKTSAPNSP